MFQAKRGISRHLSLDAYAQAESGTSRWVSPFTGKPLAKGGVFDELMYQREAIMLWLPFSEGDMIHFQEPLFAFEMLACSEHVAGERLMAPWNR